uniref:RWP-RK domain-containing protein n=1 Tax=Hanusia phi TaxID=3032 RepID=A0A7S0F190_9CRYP|mmetsp:Transcript_33618/g.75543  ORF Transcript_33618/g.75543 Transcript_33618/m.75543 type:complete len:225 (+) Transcript_33618:152-826(+)|eukprot:768793-Hanusia_phi.AAC.3
MEESSKRRSVALVCPRKKKEGEGSQQQEEPVVLTRELLESYFHCSLSSVSAQLGICPTAIKRACRKLGIAKWPFKTPNPGPKKKKDSAQQLESHEREGKCDADLQTISKLHPDIQPCRPSLDLANDVRLTEQISTVNSFENDESNRRNQTSQVGAVEFNPSCNQKSMKTQESTTETLGSQPNFLDASLAGLDTDPFAADTISFLRDVCKCRTTFYQQKDEAPET